MTSKLPININDLLHQRKVEGDRIEFKAGWNPDPILRTLCAFANDFENLGGGYVVIGQDCDKSGVAIFPPVGLPEDQLDTIQRELLGFCNLIQPPYFPMLSIEKGEGKHLIVLWAPGGQNRPYKVPRAVTARKKDHRYYIRRYSSTVEAKGDDERELISLTARVPIEVRITPEDLVVLSFPGPDRSIKMDDLRRGKGVSRRYRNRRIGEFLKELDLTEGRSTGISKILNAMKANGSPVSEFETDEDRTYFLIRLPVHPEKTSEKILTEIRKNRDVTIAELSKITGVTTRSVERNLKKLQKSGHIDRVGPDKGGHWEARDK